MFLEKIDGDMVAFYCPGCECSHMVDPKRWAVDMENDTIHPSVLVRGGETNMRCHSFVRNGKIQYLNDCTHSLAGKIVDMEEI